jgi:DNA-binding NarL/FixJ family response regulator/regulator of sirC expression with transglutaminase-like and TPR domain
VPNRLSQQLIVLRAQRFVKRQRLDVQTINVEAVELGIELDKDEEAKEPSRLSAMQQAREHLVAQDIDPSEAVLRDRVISELLHYLESQGHSDCADYLVLKLQNLAASDIDEILGLTPRERDYLQKRFKYHVEKFSRSSHWKLVHQWLGADLDQKLGMSSKLWESFVGQLNEQQQQLLSLKQAQKSEQEIAKALGWTPKQVQKRWTALLEVAWKTRNSVGSEEEDITAPALRRTNDTSERNLVSEGSNGKPLKFYLPLELDRQLKFKATANSEPTSAIVERALVSFLNKTDESEKSDGQTHQISTYQDYEKLIEINPNDYKAWYGCGVVLKNLGSYEEAIASLDKALEIKPDSHKAWYARGNALYGLDFYEEAIASYNKAIELKPDYAEAWHYRGKALDELGRHEEASANYKRILKIKSDYNTISNKREKAPGDLGGYEGQHPVLRVLVVDEHELTRFSLKLALSSQSQIDLVGLASNGKEAIEMIERYRPDVIILDLQMPVMDGLSASTHIKSISPTTQIIAYASVEDPQIEVMAQTAPIDVFCKKDTATKDLINLVKQLGKRKVTQQEHSA